MDRKKIIIILIVAAVVVAGLVAILDSQRSKNRQTAVKTLHQSLTRGVDPKQAIVAFVMAYRANAPLLGWSFSRAYSPADTYFLHDVYGYPPPEFVYTDIYTFDGSSDYQMPDYMYNDVVQGGQESALIDESSSGTGGGGEEATTYNLQGACEDAIRAIPSECSASAGNKDGPRCKKVQAAIKANCADKGLGQIRIKY